MQNSSRCSFGVNWSNKISNCGHTPIVFLISSISSNISRLKTEAVPEVAGYIPVRIDIVVVFPAPLCPSKAKICPLYIVNETSLTASLPLL